MLLEICILSFLPQAAQALLVKSELTLVCEEDGTEVDSDEFFIALPDNTVFMALNPGEIWKPHPVCMCVCVKQKPFFISPRIISWSGFKKNFC